MSDNFFPTEYQSYIHKSRYARWLPDQNRRETWAETVDRYFNFFDEHLLETCSYKIDKKLREELWNSVANLEIMPSMRCLMAAGEALKRENVSGYNCANTAIDSPRAFDEILYVLMNGTGIGFSVEQKYVDQLPVIAEDFHDSDTTIVVADSKLGWAKALKELIHLLYGGQIPKWDISKVRPAGAPLKTFGGRACLTGDTVLYKDRKKSRGYNQITIKELFDLERSQGFWKNKPNHFKDIKLRSLNEETGMFFRNRVLGVVDNGMASVYEIKTENGYKIKATDNHRFLDSSGEYRFVKNYEIGDLIGVNGASEIKTGTCIDCGVSITRRANRCKSCFDETQKKVDCLDTTSRQRKEVRMYRESKQICELCGVDENTANLEVHHIDGNPWNNQNDNMLVCCPPCHRKEDMKRIYMGDAYSCKYLLFDKIISIECAGEEQVYDLQMEGPNHNFIANGFVSHNSGPEPLVSLFKFCVNIFKRAAGRKLTTIECHDIVCKIAEIVVVGGVRRSALLSLSDLSDDRMRVAKSGDWWKENPQRALANNSFVAKEKNIDVGIFMDEWKSLYESRSGERGIFSRYSAQKQASRFGRRSAEIDYFCNPCSEIILRNKQFCNLTEVVVRGSDTQETLARKIRLATILGTFQSTLTNFKYLSKKWKENTEEERLLGVSLTGIMDNKYTNGTAFYGETRSFELEKLLSELRQVAVDTNLEYSKAIKIPQSAAITCVKPSGTVSQLVDAASGIHARHSPYYIRTVRADKKDPLAKMMIDMGFPVEDDVMKPDHTYVFSFPIKSPENAIYRTDMTAIDQLELWLVYQKAWCEHKPSITVSIKEHEWLDVGAWVFNHYSEISGVSFLPYSDHVYQQAPYQDCTKEEYEALLAKMPKNIDWSLLSKYEKMDNTIGSQELACSSSEGCEL